MAEPDRQALLRQIESERARLQAVLQQLPVGVAIVEAPSGRLLLHNDEAERLLRHPLVPSNKPNTYPLFGAVHSDGRPFEPEEYPSARVIARGEAIKSLNVDYRHDDGSISHLSVNSAPIRDVEGEIVAAVTVFLDVTDRRRADEERTELLRRLVSLQEDERRRIARELHDQMGQHIAALTLGLKAVEDSPEDPRSRIEALRGIVDELGREAHRIALELRPTALDDLGLHSALWNHAEEWSERYRIDLDFQSRGLDHQRLEPNLESALYRIVQEALTNVVKHAKARRVGIILEKRSDQLIVIVEDDGVGFEADRVLDNATVGHRMGLLGMKERVALVGGTLQIESSPGAGTTILIRVPHRAESQKGPEP